MRGLVCLDMDRVLVDHLSTWQVVYDKLGVSNKEAFDLYNSGKLNEWDWMKLDLELIRNGCMELYGSELTDEILRELVDDSPLMAGWHNLIQGCLDLGLKVAIISGGMQHTARKIAASFPSDEDHKKRLGGIDFLTSKLYCEGKDTLLDVFTNGWTSCHHESGIRRVEKTGRYQVEMNGKSSIVNLISSRYGFKKSEIVSVGDSAGDITMFNSSGLGICFNPYNDVPKKHANVVIEEKNLNLVFDEIRKFLHS